MATEEVRLMCRTIGAAKEIMSHCDAVPSTRLGRDNRAIREGNVVIVTYANKMWPYDVVEMAVDLGAVSDEEAGRVLSCL